jgi:5-methyltetrahydropteroyltriglutamate--homocysteine methyltransferase
MAVAVSSRGSGSDREFRCRSKKGQTNSRKSRSGGPSRDYLHLASRGQWVTTAHYPDWESYGKAMQSLTSDPTETRPLGQRGSMGKPRSTPPYRADHVGSLLRPPELRDAHAKFMAGKLPEAELRKIEDRTIQDVIGLQESVGLQSITDGEFRRDNWRDRFFESVEGYSKERLESPFTFTEFSGEKHKGMSVPRVTGELCRRKSLATEEFSYLKKRTKRTAKLTFPSPTTNHFYLGDALIKPAYASREEYLADVAAIYKEEIADLGAAGCTYLQLDEVCLALACDPHIQDIVKGRGENFDELLAQYTEMINAIVRSRPAGMTICMHLCRGNSGHGIASGGYDPIAETLFEKMEVDGYFLEYDTQRAGDFTPLRFVPRNKTVVLGMISTKLKELEPVDELQRRVDEAARHIDKDRLCLSPQCGFASSFATDRFTFDDQKRKLIHLVEAADRIWH